MSAFGVSKVIHLHFISISVLNSFEMNKRVRGGHEAFLDLIWFLLFDKT